MSFKHLKPFFVIVSQSPNEGVLDSELSLRRRAASGDLPSAPTAAMLAQHGAAYVRQWLRRSCWQSFDLCASWIQSHGADLILKALAMKTVKYHGVAGVFIRISIHIFNF